MKGIISLLIIFLLLAGVLYFIRSRKDLKKTATKDNNSIEALRKAGDAHKGHDTESEIKAKYSDSFSKISSIVNEFDPCGLIQLGTPLDEYDCLTALILSYHQEKKSREEIKEMIIHEIEFHFECLDLSVIKEPYKTKFYNALDNLLEKLQYIA
jgi:hypothetical protein